MKFVIGVDLEGAACVVGSPGGSLNDSRNLAFAKLQATREADATARALFDAGATQVIVWDNHDGSLNLDYDRLDPRCDIALGVGFPHRWPADAEALHQLTFGGERIAGSEPAAPNLFLEPRLDFFIQAPPTDGAFESEGHGGTMLRCSSSATAHPAE